MPTKDETLDLPERPASTPTEYLIRARYKEFGCHDWTWSKFLRLARAINETDFELGARIGLTRGELSRRRTTGRFTFTEGILLSLHYRFISAVTSGQREEGELFYPLSHD